MQKRNLKTGYKTRNDWRNRCTKFFPALDLSGNWLAAAGFAIGQPVTVEVQDGILTIRAVAQQ